jgi:hypothetical protein
MKIDKKIIIILILSSLLLSALGGAFYFYTKHKNLQKNSDKLKVILVAAKDINKSKKIVQSDIKQVQIAKKYILTTPLFDREIIGKYAKENIYNNEIFRKEKLISELTDINITKKGEIEKFKNNSYNIDYKLFRNPNYTLKKDDILNIVSVYPKSSNGTNASPNAVQYVAKHIKVIGFIRDGVEVEKSIEKVNRTRMVKNKQIKEEVDVKANELILDIDSGVLLKLIDDYNRGSQLWMVKTKLPKKKVKKETTPKKKEVKKKVTQKRSYPTRLYTPRNKFSHIKATIHYADQKDAAVTKQKTIKTNGNYRCQNSELYLIGISNKVHLRTGPSFRNKIVRIVYKNYIIPYTKKVNDDWYLVCDGRYVNAREAKPIPKELALRKLGK